MECAGRPVRILEVLSTSSPGGAARHVWDLLRHLPKEEFEPVIASPRDGVLFDRFRDLGLRVVEFPRHKIGAHHVLLAIRLISTLGIDIVHTHGKGPGIYGRLAAGWSRVPAIHTLHAVHCSARPSLGQRLHLALERGLARGSHTIINVSTSQKVEASALRLFRDGQGVVIVNGVDLDEMERQTIHSATSRETLGLTTADVVIGNISRLDPGKHIELLVETVQRLKPRLPHLVLVLVGDGPEEPRIRRLVFERGLQQSVILTGSLPNTLSMYPVFDLYIAASRKEGLPMSLVEAMAAGLPVVATDVPGHRDVVLHGETGMLVPPGDSKALAQAVASLVSDPVRRKTMGERGRRRAHQDFAVRAMVDATAQVYRQAVSRRHRSRFERAAVGQFPRV